MELPVIDVADVKANCSSHVKNYHVCDRSHVTGSKDVIRLILFFMIHDIREPTCV